MNGLDLFCYTILNASCENGALSVENYLIKTTGIKYANQTDSTRNIGNKILGSNFVHKQLSFRETAKLCAALIYLSYFTFLKLLNDGNDNWLFQVKIFELLELILKLILNFIS